MKPYYLYDLPTRIFHWLFAGFFLIAFIISKTVDDDSSLFSWHMLAGMLLVFVAFLRIILGIVGGNYSKFSRFSFDPRDLFHYFKGILTGDKKRWHGHNPASSWVTVIMLALALGLGITGYLMSSGGENDFYEELHELLANAFIIVVILHICGIVLHTLRHREMISLSMIGGRKKDLLPNADSSSNRTTLGLIFLGLVIIFGVYLGVNYNSSRRSINIFGTMLSLGESEENESKENHKKSIKNQKKNNSNSRKRNRD